MARTFKFSFPLPSRRPSAERQPTLIYDEYDTPLYNPGAKAETILGTSERSVVEVKKQSLKKEKKIRRYPSFMSVIISETDSSVHKNGDFGSERSPQLHSQPSPPLLGQQHANESPDRDSAAGFFGSQHRSQSSSSLRSYYDPSKSPLNISQQTSASSARDMALRKGHFTIASPQDRKVSDVANSPRKKDSKHTKESSKASTKHHPPSNFQLDIPSTFQQPHASNCLILSPDRAVRSPSQVSLGSNLLLPTQSGRAKWFSWERKKSKEITPTFKASFEEVPKIKKSNEAPLKSSAAKSPKIYKNWFNDILEEENILEDRSQDRAHKANNTSVTLKRDENVEIYQTRKSKSKIGDVSYDSTLSNATPRTVPNVALVQSALSPKRQRAHSNGTQRTSSNDSRKSEASRKPGLTFILSKTDLHAQSFLALTSSEDESEDQPSNEVMSRRHRIRASIEKADTGDEVLVCSAERVTPVKPRPVVNRPRRRSFKKPDVIPPVPGIPTRPQPNPRVSSMKWQDEMKVLPTSTENRKTPDHSREGSSASRSASQLSQSSSLRMATTRGSKMMAVTAEEEKLLEAMRRKRASIRQEALAEQSDGTNQMHSNSNSISRPRTAGAGDRPAPSSYFDIDRSASSPLPAHGYAKYIDTPFYAASAGNMSNDDSSPPPSPSSFPQTPAAFSLPPFVSKHISIQQSSKKTAPSLSFSPSDILPSTPAMSDATGEEIYGTFQHGSRTSPVTPPPGHILDVYESELAITTSHPHDSALYMDKKSHDKKRAMSSSVFVLNGVERETQELGEENEMTRWTMDKW